MPPAAVTTVVVAVVLAASTPWPAVLAGVAVVVAVCLWLLFRPGSMAHRARADHPEETGGDPPGESDDAQSPGGR